MGYGLGVMGYGFGAVGLIWSTAETYMCSVVNHIANVYMMHC